MRTVWPQIFNQKLSAAPSQTTALYASQMQRLRQTIWQPNTFEYALEDPQWGQAFCMCNLWIKLHHKRRDEKSP